MNDTVKPVRIGYVETAMSMVRDCQSGDPSRLFYCIISTVIGSMSAVLLPIMIIVGTIGNAIVAHVMLRRQKPLTRQNVYLGCIAMADILSLIVIGMFNGFLTKGLPWITGGRMAFISYNLSDAMCKVSRYALNFCHVLSCLLLLVLVTDRVLVVHRPLVMKKFGRRWAVRALIAGTMLAVVIALPNGILVGHQTVTLQDGTVLIYCYHLHDTQLLMLAYTSLMSNPPLIIILVMLVLNCFLVSRVVSAIRKRRSLSNSNEQQLNMKDISGTVIVLILAILYLVLHTPLLFARIFLEVSEYLMDMLIYRDYLIVATNVFYCSIIISLVNQCITFFVLFRRSDSFRRCVLALLCCSASRDAHISETELASANPTAQ